MVARLRLRRMTCSHYLVSMRGSAVQVGDTTRLSVLGRVDGLFGLFSYDRVLDATWRSSDPGIARVEKLPPPSRTDSTTPAQVLVRGVAPGTARVTAAARGIVG